MKQFTHSLGLLTSLAWDDYRQKYHTGDSRVLRWSELGLMVFLLCLSLTSSSIQHYLQNNLNQLLGADIVISQYQPLTFEQRQFLTENSDKLSQSLLLDITLTHNSQWQQVQLKLVDDQYPLKGELVLAKAPGANGTASLSGPVEGEIWVDARLYSKLGLDIGQELDVAGQNLVVSAILLHEPDRLLEGHSVAMRAMVEELGDPTYRPTSATTLFCSPVPDGHLEIRVEVLRKGGAAAQLRAALSGVEVLVSDIRTDPWDFAVPQEEHAWH